MTYARVGFYGHLRVRFAAALTPPVTGERPGRSGAVVGVSPAAAVAVVRVVRQSDVPTVAADLPRADVGDETAQRVVINAPDSNPTAVSGVRAAPGTGTTVATPGVFAGARVTVD